MREPPLWVLLLSYCLCSFTYSLLLGLLGRSGGSPLSTFQVYALAMPCWFLCGALVEAGWRKWRTKRSEGDSQDHSVNLPTQPPNYWPPTRRESLAALASVMILASETLSLLMPQSVVAVVAGKGGCLLIPDPTDERPVWQRYAFAVPVFLAVALAAMHKPLRVLLVPLGLALVYIAGNALKLRACRSAKREDGAKGGFLRAGQLVVLGLSLALSSVFSHFARPAALGDWRLWLVAGCSMGCGLIGTRLVLHRTRQAVVYPAYRAASLLCALGASAARGEALSWSGWLAVGIALCVVLWASGGPSLVSWVQERRLRLAAVRIAA